MAATVVEMPAISGGPIEQTEGWRELLTAAEAEIRRARGMKRESGSVQRKLRREAILLAIDLLDRAGEVLP